MILGPHILQRRRNPVNGDVTLFKVCSVTLAEYSVTLSDADFRLLLSPECPLIQDALPNYTADQREFIMTGITPAEFARLYPEM